MRKQFIWSAIFLNFLVYGLGTYINPIFFKWYWLIGPLTLIGVHDILQKKHTLLKNYPIFGHGRYLMEELRPKIYQYFVESDTDGTPINRIFRSIIYQRAKLDLSTTPFGTQLNVDEVGYEWVNHSMNPLDLGEISLEQLRVEVGSGRCSQPYSCSVYNISAMSFGALSKNAIEALNWGAKEGGFAHNTGEGGLSTFHLKHGGDVIWQIGTGYFGCRDEKGNFSDEKFTENATKTNVKMIELKLSQGAKPGHGGILPAHKNTPEIAAIRGVQAGIPVISPSRHHAFNNHHEMLNFIEKLRKLSGGKPVGIKLCFGYPSEFESLCQAIVETGKMPDYISVDGGEGGTGAAPLEFSNSIGMSMRDGLIFVRDYLDQYGLRPDIKIFVGGKIITGFHLFRAMALGADVCYSARGMMIALGCIQALICNTNRCPTGVATQDPSLSAGLDVGLKHVRIKNFHHGTVESLSEIMCAAGIKKLSDINRSMVWRRMNECQIRNYQDLFPYKTATKERKKSRAAY